MKRKYEKVCYDTNFGYSVHHTMGTSAEKSTLGYLHYPVEFMFYYFIHGSGIAKIDGKHYDIGEGDIIILTPSELFYCAVDKDKLHERIVLHVNETILKHFPADSQSLFMPFYKLANGAGNRIPAEMVRSLGLDTAFRKLMSILREEDSTSSILGICKAVEILAHIGKAVSVQKAGKNQKACENPLIHRVIDYLNRHFKEDINISQIALRFNVDRSYLSHLFKENTGVSLWNYVIYRRINLFNNLVKEGHSIEETSRQVGFGNYSNFFRLYKKNMNMTPKEFKKEIYSGTIRH